MATKRRNNRIQSPRRPGGPKANSRAAARVQASGRRRRRRRGNKILHYLLLAVFLAVVGSVLSMTVFFKIERVDVIGVDRYTPDEIAQASGIVQGDNLLRIDKADVEAAILEQFPYIDQVRVRRKIPPAVEIEVTQAEPIGAILQGEEVLLIDEWGKVVERGVIMVPDGVLVVKGIDAATARPGEILGEYTPPAKRKGEALTPEEEREKLRAEEVREKLGMLRTLLGAMEETEFERLTNVDLSDRLNMRVAYENRITLELGVESQLKYKLTFIQYVLDNEIAPDERGTLDATDAARNRVSFLPESAGGDLDKTVVIVAPKEGEEGGEMSDSVDELE